MAVNPCKACEQEPAAFLVTEISSGDTMYIGLACLPPFVATVWEDAGLPNITFDVDVPEPDDASLHAGENGSGQSDEDWEASAHAEPKSETTEDQTGAVEAQSGDEAPAAASGDN